MSVTPNALVLLTDETIRAAVCAVLREHGYDIIQALSEDEVLSAHTEVSVIGGENRFALCQQVRERCADECAIILVIDSETQAESALSAGADYYLTTPILENVLRIYLRRIMRQTSARRELLYLSKAIESASDSIIIADTQAHVLYQNSAFVQLYGYTLDDLNSVENPPGLFVDPDVEETAFRAALQGSWTGEVELRTKDGHVMPAIIRGDQIIDSDGALLGLIGLIRDISQDKQIESQLRTHARQQAAVAELSQQALSGVDLDVLMKQAAALVTETLGIELCRVMELLPDGETLFMRAGIGWRDGLVGVIKVGTAPTIQEGHTLIASNHVVVEDLAAENRFTPSGVLLEHGAVSGVEVIVPGKDHPFGLLGAFSTTSRQFSEDDIHFLHSVANFLAAAVEHHRAEIAEAEQRVLAEALRKTASALSDTLNLDEVLQRILDNVTRVIPADTATIMMVEGGVAHVVRHIGYNERSLVDQIMKLRFPVGTTPNLLHMSRTRQPVAISDVKTYEGWLVAEGTHWIGSYVGAPIFTGDHVIGFINLDSATRGTFTAFHAERLQAFADQVGVAIKNARLYDASRRHAEELAALYRATQFLFTSDNIEDMGYQIAQAVIQEFGHVDCGVILLDDDKRLIRLARLGEFNAQTNAPLLFNGGGLVPEAIRTGLSIYAPDVSLDPRYVVGEERTKSELVVPLHTGKGVVGTLDLQSPSLNAFNPQSRRILKAFAKRAAAAIETAVLYEQARRHADELELRVAERTAALHAANEQIKAVFNSSSDALVMTRMDGTVLQVNPAFYQVFGYQPYEIAGRSLLKLVHLDHAEKLEETFASVAADHQPRRVEVVAQRRDGTVFSADAALFPVTERDSNITLNVVCSLRDITKFKEIEAELRKALSNERELNELKSRFVATTSHEFRTPLAKILTASDLLRNYADRMSDEQKQERLDKIQVEVHNMNRLLDDVLTISRAEEVGKEDFEPLPTDLKRFLEEVVAEVRFTFGGTHEFAFTANGNCPDEMSIDEKRFRQSIVNLLSNAVKYSPPGSTVHISLMCGLKEAVIYVRDEGIGIPQNDQARLFDAFHRARNVGHISGTGLGLTIAKQAVDLHGGTISFETEVGVGTTFKITLPKGR